MIASRISTAILTALPPLERFSDTVDTSHAQFQIMREDDTLPLTFELIGWQAEKLVAELTALVLRRGQQLPGRYAPRAPTPVPQQSPRMRDTATHEGGQ